MNEDAIFQVLVINSAQNVRNIIQHMNKSLIDLRKQISEKIQKIETMRNIPERRQQLDIISREIHYKIRLYLLQTIQNEIHPTPQDKLMISKKLNLQWFGLEGQRADNDKFKYGLARPLFTNLSCLIMLQQRPEHVGQLIASLCQYLKAIRIQLLGSEPDVFTQIYGVNEGAVPYFWPQVLKMSYVRQNYLQIDISNVNIDLKLMNVDFLIYNEQFIKKELVEVDIQRVIQLTTSLDHFFNLPRQKHLKGIWLRRSEIFNRWKKKYEMFINQQVAPQDVTTRTWIQWNRLMGLIRHNELYMQYLQNRNKPAQQFVGVLTRKRKAKMQAELRRKMAEQQQQMAQNIQAGFQQTRVFKQYFILGCVALQVKIQQYLVICQYLQQHTDNQMRVKLSLQFVISTNQRQQVAFFVQHIFLYETILRQRIQMTQKVYQTAQQLSRIVGIKFQQKLNHYYALWQVSGTQIFFHIKSFTLCPPIIPIHKTENWRQNSLLITYGVFQQSSSLFSARYYIWEQQMKQRIPLQKVWTVYGSGLYSIDAQSNAYTPRLKDLKFQDCYIGSLALALSMIKKQPITQQSVEQLKKFLKDKLPQAYQNNDIVNSAKFLNIGIRFNEVAFQQTYGFIPEKHDIFIIVQDTHCFVKKLRVQQIKHRHPPERNRTSLQQIGAKQLVDKPNEMSIFVIREILKNRDMTFQQFSKLIQYRFATFDIETYAISQVRMPIYLGCFTFWIGQRFLDDIFDYQILAQDNVMRKVGVKVNLDNFKKPWFKKKDLKTIQQTLAFIIITVSNINAAFTGYKTIWWTFNGLNFDYVYILQQLVSFGNKFNTFGKGRQSKGYRNQTCILQDGLNFIKGKLKDLTKQNNKTYVKKSVDITKITTQTQYRLRKEQIQQYCLFDCLSLEQLMIRFFLNVWKVAHEILYERQSMFYRNPIDFNYFIQRPTASNFTLYLFQMLFIKGGYVCPDTQQIIKQQRQSYSGGMVQITKHIIPEGQQVIQMDANAMYPSCMKYLGIWQTDFFLHNDETLWLQVLIRNFANWSCLRQFYTQKQLKYSKGQYHQRNDSNPKLFYDSLTSRYKLGQILYPKHFLPNVPYRTRKHGLIYFSQFHGPLWVSGHFILCCIINHIQIVIVDYRGRSSFRNNKYDNPFWQFVSYCYQKRLIYKATKQTGLADSYKLMLNSLYGKLLQKKFPTIQIWSQQFLKRKNRYNIGQNTQRFYYQQKPPDNQPFSGELIAIGATITQISRIKVANLLKFAMGKTFYCDTDSSYVTRDTIQQLRKVNYIVQGEVVPFFGKQLGQWKQQNPQYPFTRGVFINRKTLCLQSQKRLLSIGGEKIMVKRTDTQLIKKWMQQNEEEQPMDLQTTIRDLFYKVRLKGINYKPRSAQCRQIIQKFITVFNNMPKGYSTPEQIQLGVQFKVQSWRKSFKPSAQSGGVTIAQIIKRTFIHFKRNVLQDGDTIAKHWNPLYIDTSKQLKQAPTLYWLQDKEE